MVGNFEQFAFPVLTLSSSGLGIAMDYDEAHDASEVTTSESLRLCVLGRVEVTRDGVAVDDLIRRRKPLALLAYLALEGTGKFFQRDHLCGIFWPETNQTRARGSLRQALATIRKELSEVFEFRGDEELRVAPGRISNDFTDFLGAVGGERWTDAAALDRGDAFDGFHVAGADRFEDWVSSLQLRQSRARAEVPEAVRVTAPRKRGPAAPGRDGHAPPSVAGPAAPPRPPLRGLSRFARLTRLAFLPAAAVAVVLVAAIAARRPSLPGVPTIVVSTPEHLGSDEDGVFFTRGMQDEVVAHLSRIQGFSLVPTRAVRAAPGG